MTDPATTTLADHLGTRADQLSAGTARRLLLDAVLALPAPVVVLDEPSAGLDARPSTGWLRALTERLAGGGTVVVAEHRPLPLPGGTVLDLGGGSAAASSRCRAACTLSAGHGADRTAELTVPPRPSGTRCCCEALERGWSVLAVGAAAR